MPDIYLPLLFQAVRLKTDNFSAGQGAEKEIAVAAQIPEKMPAEVKAARTDPVGRVQLVDISFQSGNVKEWVNVNRSILYFPFELSFPVAETDLRVKAEHFAELVEKEESALPRESVRKQPGRFYARCVSPLY